ncbi:rod shape-determining protein RodA [Clostridiales bacterium COT073_COT-073]|nr:rod shape-determining protein RodA [Clostridiales bacterium COT073_COT-073]
MLKKYQWKRFDWLTLLTVAIIVGIGVVAISSATYGTDYYVKRQILGFATGLILLLITALIDYHFITKMSPLVYLLNIGLLVAVWRFGEEKFGGTRWLMIAGFQIQPSEFGKLFMIIVLAKYFDIFKEKINHPLVILGSLALIGVPFLLVLKQPDLSTSLIFIVLFVVMIYGAKISYKYIIAVLVIAVPSFLLVFQYVQKPDQKLLSPHQYVRVMAMLHPEEFPDKYYQTINSMQAIGSGQLSGKGLYQGKLHQYDYLPVAESDFIFSIIGEEFGFVGCILLLALFFLLLIRILLVVKDSPDLTGRLIGMGYVGMLTAQIFINIGVTTGIVPNTGLPLPYVSYGISSMWSNMIILGLILNISMQRTTELMRRKGEFDIY